MTDARQKNVFLTGASSGIGRAIAQILLQKGYAVWGTSRSKERLSEAPGFHALEMRLDHPDSIQRAWSLALQEAGRIEIVIQNAGAGIFGAIEDVSLPDARAQWQVLVEGPLHLFRLAAEHMRPRRTGTIIGVSSLAAELPMPFSAHYSAGKAAFSALLAGLAMELKPFHIQVIDLRPGDIKTAFNDELPRTMPPTSAYLPWTQTAWRESVRLMQEAPPPELIARGMVKLLRQKNPPAVARLGTFFQAKLGPLGVRFLPHRWLRESIRSYYRLNKVDEEQRDRD